MSKDKKADSLSEAIEKLNQDVEASANSKVASENTEGADDPSAEKVAELEVALEKANKDYLYLRADFDNFKRSAIKERSDLIKYGSERLITELLGTLDTFDQALAMDINPENLKSFTKGVELIRTELNNTLNRFGVSAMESLGEKFDPNVHEALSAEPSTEIPAGHISQVFKKAYKMHDKVIRPAQVVVAKEPVEPQEEKA